jgi:hypothetical protein
MTAKSTRSTCWARPALLACLTLLAAGLTLQACFGGTAEPTVLAAADEARSAESGPGDDAAEDSGRPRRKLLEAVRKRHGGLLRRGLTEEQKAEVKAFVENHLPELWEHYRKAQAEGDQRLIRRMHAHILPLYLRVIAIPEEEQAVREAVVGQHRVRPLMWRAVRKYRAADEAEQQEQAEAELRELIGREFDYDQTIKGYKIRLLEARLAELKAEVDQRQANRKQIIRKRIERWLEGKPAARSDRPHRRRHGDATPPPPREE